jgi:hypothetical protein
MSALVSEDTLSQTSSTTTTFSNYKTQDHNSIYTTMCYKSLRTFHQQHLTSSTTTTFGNYKTPDHNSIYTTTGYKSLRSRAKLIPIGLGVAEMGGILAM